MPDHPVAGDPFTSSTVDLAPANREIRMSKLASAMREEIKRLARKEIKAQVGSTKQASSQHRRDIAQLKRQVQDLTRRVAFLERQERKRALAPVPEGYGSHGPQLASTSRTSTKFTRPSRSMSSGQLLHGPHAAHART